VLKRFVQEHALHQARIARAERRLLFDDLAKGEVGLVLRRRIFQAARELGQPSVCYPRLE